MSPPLTLSAWLSARSPNDLRDLSWVMETFCKGFGARESHRVVQAATVLANDVAATRDGTKTGRRWNGARNYPPGGRVQERSADHHRSGPMATNLGIDDNLSRQLNEQDETEPLEIVVPAQVTLPPVCPHS